MSSSIIEPSAADEPRTPVATPARRATDMPAWYRREAWLAVTLSAFLPILVGFATPQSTHVLLLSLAGALLVVGLFLLIRRGATA